MASETPLSLLFTTCRSCLRLSRPARLRVSPASSSLAPFRPLSTARRLAQDVDIEAATRPRWQRTPPAMAMPVRSRPRPKGPEFVVNDDPRKLDQMYTSFLGSRDPNMQLSEEVKWLAVTHKSFDHGRRGFNDRLAFLGRPWQTCLPSASCTKLIATALHRKAPCRPPTVHGPSQRTKSADLSSDSR